MKIRTLMLIPALLLSSGLQAESDYEKWRRQKLTDFQAYLDENDKAFIQFLQQKWQPVDVAPARQRDPQPKPVELPKAPKPAPVKPTPVDVSPIVKVPEPAPVVQQRPQPVVVISPPASHLPQVSFDFYGHSIRIPYAKELRKSFSGDLNSKNIAAYWQQLATSPHKDTVSALQAQAKALQLNDWGTAKLFDQFARQLHRDNNSRQLTSWFLLVKAGYDARVAYNQRIHLLLTSEQEMFGVTFFTLSNKRYYAVNLNEQPLKPGKVFTYEGQHEEGRRALDFSNPTRFTASGNTTERQLKFQLDGKDYRINVQYPERYVSYFSSFPQLSLPNYFRAGLPAVTADSLLQQLRPVVEGQSELDAANRLLRFVQTAFAYKTDDDQFGQENYLFPLETLHYPYSDCEDRAALFAWLVESLLGLDAVILDYPGHVATAVAFHGNVKGDAVMYNGKRFVVADPTFVNASAGMTMPQYANSQPKVVAF